MTDISLWTPNDNGEGVDMRNKQHFTGINYTYRFNDNARLENRISYQTFNAKMDVDMISYMNKSTERNIEAIPQESMLNLGDDYNNSWDHIFVNKGIGYNYGVEFTLEKFFDKRFYFLLTTTLYDSKYKGYDGVRRDTKFNGNFALNFLGGYEIKISQHSLISFNLKTAYMGNKRYTPTISDNGFDMERDYANINSIKLPYYFRTDINVNVKTNFKRVSVEYFFEIDNLTNRKNVWRRYFDANQNQDRYTYQQNLTPMGGVKVYF